MALDITDSYLSRISRIISVEKILPCGEISDFCKESEQFMAFYRNLCRFCFKFVWRKSLWRKNDKYEVCYQFYTNAPIVAYNCKLELLCTCTCSCHLITLSHSNYRIINLIISWAKFSYKYIYFNNPLHTTG